MIDRFKLQFLIVLILIAACTLMMKNDYYRQSLLPVISYIMQPNETLQEALDIVFDRTKGMPVASIKPEELFDRLCAYQSVRQEFGWYQAGDEEKFCNGVYLVTKKETPVKAPLSGEIMKVVLTDSTIGVLQQCGDFFCFYSGLEALVVDEGKIVQAGEILGYSGAMVYFEVRDVNGVINPEFILQKK